MSIEYYSRLERGALAGVSAQVLDAIARALRLDDAERAHLFHLAEFASGAPRRSVSERRPRNRWTARPNLQWTLDVMATPAMVVNSRQDLLATNRLGRAMHDSLHNSLTTPPGAAPNFSRFIFLDPAAQDFYPDWPGAADLNVAISRNYAGRYPQDKALHDLVGELSTRSTEFARRWSAHNVRIHGTGIKSLHHGVVGALTLAYENMSLNAEPDLSFTIYTAEPASPSAAALALLASWAAAELNTSA